MGVNRAIKQEKVYTQEQLKLTHINFVVLNSYEVIYLRFIKKTYFWAVKNLNVKIAVSAFFKEENLLWNGICQKIVYISKPVKNVKLLPAEKFGNINLYQQTVLLKTIYDFRKCIFNCNKCILVRLWVKVLVSQGWVQS